MLAEDHKLINAARRGRGEKEIPYSFASFFKGTQNPVFMLRFSSVITVVTGNAYNTVIAINASQFPRFADLANLFDEYRPIMGRVHFYGKAKVENTGANILHTGFGYGVVDYADSTAITTHQNAVEYDTHKPFSYDSRSKLSVQKWQLQFEPLPDQDWIPIATQSTNFCWWKPVIIAADVDFGVTGVATVEIEVAFQMRAMV